MMLSDPQPGHWLAAPASQTFLLPHRARLALPAAPVASQYRVHSGWSETVAGTARRTRLERTVGLHLAPCAGS